MDLKHVETAYEFLKQNNSVDVNHLEELFLIGRLTDNESILEEISSIFKTTDKTVQAVWNSKIKISNLGTYKDTDARLKSLMSIAKKTPLLQVGKMWQLLQSDLEFIYNENDEELKEKYEFSLEIGIYKSSPFVKDPTLISKFNGIKKIRISDAFHSALPQEIGDLTLLEELEIDEAKISTLPDNLKNLESLKKLELKMPNLEVIPEFLKDLPSLETIEIQGGRYSYVETKFKIPAWIGEMKQLKSLKLFYLSEEQFPENLFPVQLESVDFAQLTNLKSVPPIAHCINLKTFEIATSPLIEELPKGMATITTLENLELINMEGLKKLDGNLIYAPHIKNLKLSGVEATISEPERKINETTELTIRNGNYLKYVLENPDLFPNLKELTVTSIKNNIETVGSFGKLTKLEKLKLSDNKEMQQIITDLGNCISLEEIEFFNMDLNQFPDLSTIKHVKKIRILNGDKLHFQFSNLPQKVDSLEVRGILKLDFYSVTAKIVQTFELQTSAIVNFNDIGLHDFQSIYIYTALKSVDGEVYAEKLPLSISKIENLVSFTFYGKIKQVDDCFSMLNKLETISIAGYNFSPENHPIEAISSDILKNKNLKSITIENYIGENLNELLENASNIESLKLKKIDGFDFLPDLTHLENLKHVTIDSCDSFVSLANPLPTLESVAVDFCKNASIKIYEELEAIKTLRSVSLTYLGKWFDYFPVKFDFLEKLKLNSLNISEIPVQIQNFKNLNTLELDSMYIRKLPKEMASLSNLRNLAIDNNLLEEFPVEFAQLQLEQVRMFFSKFAGNNMKREAYAILINDNCNLVKKFDGEVYYWQTIEARDYRKKHYGI